MGTVMGALVGVCYGFAACESINARPWIVTVTLGGLIGGLILGFVFLVPVGVVHGIWWLATARAKRTPAIVPDETPLP